MCGWLGAYKVSMRETRSLQIKEDSIGRYSINKGDVLIIRVNGSADIVGRFICCEEDYDAIYCDHFIRMRFRVDLFEPEYLSLIGSTRLVRERIEKLFVSTAGQKTVNQKHIGSLVLAIPPIAEQKRILKAVDELTHMCNQLKIQVSKEKHIRIQLADAMAGQALKNQGQEG